MRLWMLPFAALSLSAFAAAPVVVSVDLSAPCGRIKPMNGVNNGPVGNGRAPELGNENDFAALEIPFVRTHDSSFCPAYGGEHTVDISAIFPDFSADESDTASYDFTFTDSYLASIRKSGARVYYRLGQKIEHGAKKYHTRPSDFKKWARIAERVVARYPDVAYWEIWNEPDHSAATWGGRKEEFWDFYETVAKHLKSKFPGKMFGGPAVAGSQQWGREFLAEMRRRDVPIDFVSWHLYASDPMSVAGKAREWRDIIDGAGYANAESHLTEWNYIRGWRGPEYVSSMQAIAGVKGAAFAASFMAEAQRSPVDLMTYYDARPSKYNGLFSPYDNSPMATYWVFDAWRSLAELGVEVSVRREGSKRIHAAAASDGRRFAVLVASFEDDAGKGDVTRVSVSVPGAEAGSSTVKMFDSRHAFQSRPALAMGGVVGIDMEPCSFVLVEGGVARIEAGGAK